MRIPFLPTMDHRCGNSPQVNTESMDFLNFSHTYPPNSIPFFIRLLPFSTPFPSFVSRLSLVFTLSYIFLIHSISMVEPSSSSFRLPSMTPPLVSLDSTCLLPPSPPKSTLFIVQCLYSCFHARSKKHLQEARL